MRDLVMGLTIHPSFDISHCIFGDNEEPPQKEPPEQPPPRKDPPPDEPSVREPEQNPKPIKFELGIRNEKWSLGFRI